MMKMNKKLMVILIVLFLLTLSSAVNAETVETENTSRDIWTNDQTIINNKYDVGLPNKDLDDLGEHIDRKGNEVVGFLMRISQPVMLVAMIIGIFLVVIGGRKGRSTGVAMIIFSIIGYTAVLFAPEIMQFVQSWMIS